MIDSQTQRILSGTLTLAKQLGAMVFTYKGEDIVGTILGFAKEYRVGHIVIGSPGPMSFHKRLLGKKNIAERLIENSRGITVVVLDTRKYEIQSAKIPAHVPEETSEAVGSASSLPRLSLSSILSPHRILIWNEPVRKEEVLRKLIEAAAADGGIPDVSSVWEEVIESEGKGSTFFNEGAAFPHVRIRGLPSPIVSLGLTHKGVADVATDNPIEFVFLILSPAESPEIQLRALAVASRATQSRYLFWNLKSARIAEEAMEDIRDWEALEE